VSPTGSCSPATSPALPVQRLSVCRWSGVAVALHVLPESPARQRTTADDGRDYQQQAEACHLAPTGCGMPRPPHPCHMAPNVCQSTRRLNKGHNLLYATALIVSSHVQGSCAQPPCAHGLLGELPGFCCTALFGLGPGGPCRSFLAAACTQCYWQAHAAPFHQRL